MLISTKVSPWFGFPSLLLALGCGTASIGDGGVPMDPSCNHEESCGEEVSACADITCGGHGSCEVVDGRTTCLCDQDYHPVHLRCVPDTAAATLSWNPPTTYEDGSSLDASDLGGYVVRYGSGSGAYTTAEDIGMPSCRAQGAAFECEHVLNALPSGNWYFTVSAYDVYGNESAPCQERSKHIP